MIERKIKNDVLNALNDNRIPVIIGLRRIGKSTLLEQIAKEEVSSRIYTCDSFDNVVKTEIQFFEELRLAIKNGLKMILLDEIQALPHWDTIIKSLYDEFVAKKICKVVVTGSSSMILDNRDLGVNRTRKLFMETWDFEEYCQLTKKIKSFENFEYYLGKGGFPEYFKSDITYTGLLNETLKPIIENDIPSAYPGTDATNLLRFILELSLLTNGEVNETKLKERLSIHLTTVKNYLDILEKARLLKIVYRVDERGIMPKKKQYKVYLNPHIHIWLLRTNFKDLDNKFKGHIIESYWLHKTLANNGFWKEYYYMKSSNTGKEIDFVSIDRSLPTVFDSLYEFKYKDVVTAEDELELLNHQAQSKMIICKESNSSRAIKRLSIIDID